MSSGFLELALVSVLLLLVQAVLAQPWLYALTGRSPRQQLPLFGAFAVSGLLLAAFLDTYSDPALLARAGRIYMAVLHLQVAVDVFVLAFWSLLVLWPKGAAVALAAFQEGVR